MSNSAASRAPTRWLIAILAAGVLLIAVVAAALVYMGSFDVAADKPHSQTGFLADGHGQAKVGRHSRG